MQGWPGSGTDVVGIRLTPLLGISIFAAVRKPPEDLPRRRLASC
jgi:hypothetical protein